MNSTCVGEIMNKYSEIYTKISTDELQKLLDTSNSISDVLRKLSRSISTGGNYRTLMRRISDEGLSLDMLSVNRSVFFSEHSKKVNRRIPDAELFIKNSKHGRNLIRNRLLKNKLIPYKCSGCGIKNIYNDAPISLQIDHINGINNDHRIENLRYLCPNCHSQTPTYSGKRAHIHHKKKCQCGREIGVKSKICKKCSSFKKRKMPPISDVELLNFVTNLSFVEIGRKFNVSDNTVRKWCKYYNLPYRKMDMH
jgi:5-methylcytosine-specific restriction endonuclease McrA